MGLFDWGFSRNKDREIEKIDKLENQEGRDLLELENLDGYNVVESNYAVNSITEGLSVLKKQSSLIDEYREMTLYPLVDDAVDDIVNAIVSCDEDEAPISIITDKLDNKKSLTDILQQEHGRIVQLLNFNINCYDIVRSWYVDGCVAFHPIVDEKKPKDGIQKIIQLDPRGVQKINNIKIDKSTIHQDRVSAIEEFYIYDISRLKNGLQKTGSLFATQDLLKISKNAMVVCVSGIRSSDQTMILSDLEKARKTLNDMKNMENSMVMYRHLRATERLIFKIDTGTLPSKAAGAYVQEVMNKYKSRIQEYDTNTGKIISSKSTMTMGDNYWFPQSANGRSTEIDSVSGAANLNDIDDILLTQKKLTKALNVPGSRLNEDASLVLGGRSAEVSREEWKFNKFIQRKRRAFSLVFLELLRIQMIVKNHCSVSEWDDEIAPNISFKFSSDSFQRDSQELEQFNIRLASLEAAEPFIGKYFSATTIERDVLKRTDDDIKMETGRIAEDIKSGKIQTLANTPEQPE